LELAVAGQVFLPTEAIMTSEVHREADIAAGSSEAGRPGRGQARKSGSAARPAAAGEGGLISGISEVAHEATEQAKSAAASLVAEAQTQITSALDAQVQAGADVVTRVAESVRIAADHLEPDSPHLAGLVRVASDRLDDVAQSLEGQTAEDVMRTSANFIRREPALAFGAAAAVGFVLVRLLKSGARAKASAAGERPPEPGPQASRRKKARPRSAPVEYEATES
jgi:ElaB/YqjD/DUF883 family membrane-anchored ribosome-binding protein